MSGCHPRHCFRSCACGVDLTRPPGGAVMHLAPPLKAHWFSMGSAAMYCFSLPKRRRCLAAVAHSHNIVTWCRMTPAPI